MFWLYNFFLHLLIPVALVRLVIRSFHNNDYLSGWGDRFGKPKPLTTGKPVIWIHAVSVGETLAARSIVRQLQKDWSQYQILITTMTPTGAKTVKDTYSNKVSHRYIPYDLSWAINYFLQIINPACLVIMETEIWPNLIWISKKKKIPVIIANARLSERSLARYKPFRTFINKLLNTVDKVAAQTQSDFERFKSLGMNENKLMVMGNLKFDNVLIELSDDKKSGQFAITNRPVWIAASTHAGEEEIVLAAHKLILQSKPESLLILAPRHPERAVSVGRLVTNNGFSIEFKSRIGLPTDSVQVFMLDTLGELSRFYACSDVAFVGGSLIEIGGHNILEPAVLGKPVVIGQYFHNFADITRQFINANAITIVKNENELADCVIRLLNNEGYRIKLGGKGRDVIQENAGSTSRFITVLEQFLG